MNLDDIDIDVEHLKALSEFFKGDISADHFDKFIIEDLINLDLVSSRESPKITYKGQRLYEDVLKYINERIKRYS